MEVGDGPEHRPRLGLRDDRLPGEHRVAEVAHDEHPGAVVVVPRVDDGVQDGGRQPVEDAPVHQLDLAAAVVSGQPHHQVVRRVEALDDHPRAVGQHDALERRPGTAVVVDRCAVERGLEHRAIHAPIVLAAAAARSPRILTMW